MHLHRQRDYGYDFILVAVELVNRCWNDGLFDGLRGWIDGWTQKDRQTQGQVNYYMLAFSGIIRVIITCF